MELIELEQANCTGAGVLGERNEELVDTLNARNFALAEKMGLDTLLTICSTCQGVMSGVNYRLREKPDYLAKINESLSAEGLEYKGTVRVTHMMWAIVEELGLSNLKDMVVRPLNGLKIAPFYGCYILRPRYVLGMSEEHAHRDQYLEYIIDALGGEPIDYEGKLRCCGFPIMTINEDNGLKMVSNHTLDARESGAHAIVTPCPLCHLNLDEFQPKAASKGRQAHQHAGSAPAADDWNGRWASPPETWAWAGTSSRRSRSFSFQGCLGSKWSAPPPRPSPQGEGIIGGLVVSVKRSYWARSCEDDVRAGRRILCQRLKTVGPVRFRWSNGE